MPLFMAQAPKSQPHQAKTQQGKEKTGLQAQTNQHPESQCDQNEPAYLISPAHKNTPCKSYAGGDSIYASIISLQLCSTLDSTGIQVGLP